VQGLLAKRARTRGRVWVCGGALTCITKAVHQRQMPQNLLPGWQLVLAAEKLSLFLSPFQHGKDT